MTFEVGNPVFYVVHKKKCKLNLNWQIGWRIVEKTSPTTYIIHNQLTGATTKAAVIDLREATVDDWNTVFIAKPDGHVLRKSNYVIPPQSESETDESVCSSDEENEPLARIAERYRKERKDPDKEENIPPMELAKRLHNSEMHSESDSESVASLASTMSYDLDDYQASAAEISKKESSGSLPDQPADTSMSVSEASSLPILNQLQSNKSQEVKQLLSAIIGLL